MGRRPGRRLPKLPADAAVTAVALLLLTLTVIGGTATYAAIAALPALLIVPALVFGPRRRPPGPSDGEDPGGDGGSRRPDTPRGLPGGGLRLLDAEQARVRYRGEPRSTLIPPPRRRWSSEPERPLVPGHGPEAG